MAKDEDLLNLVHQNLFVRVHGKVVGHGQIYLKGSLRIHMPFDIFAGYIQEDPPTSELIKTYASIQFVEIDYKIQREVDPMYEILPETLFRGSILPRSSLSQISSPTTAFAERCIIAGREHLKDTSPEVFTLFVENCINCSESLKPLVRFLDPVYTGLLLDDYPFPNCPDKHQMAQRCLSYEFDMTYPIEEENRMPPRSLHGDNKNEPEHPLFLSLSVRAYCTRHGSDDPTEASAFTVPYMYVTPPLNVPLLPEHKSGHGSIFSITFAPYLFALEPEGLQKTIDEVNDYELFSDHISWNKNNVPKGWKVQAGLV